MLNNWQGQAVSSWLKAYLHYRFENPIYAPLGDLGLDSESFQDSQPDEAIYYLVQPTGLLYGFPNYLPLSDLTPETIFKQPKASDTGKLVFTETLLSILVADMELRNVHNENRCNRFMLALSQVMYFFIDADFSPQANYGEAWIKSLPEKLLKSWDQWLKRNLNRINLSTTFSQRLPNSFTFLEIVLCLNDQRRQAGKEVINTISKQTFFNDAFQVIHSAIQANGEVDQQEEGLLEQFTASAAYTKSSKNNLRQLVKQPLNPEDIVFTTHHPWLINRFYLEIALLFIMADREIDEEEEQFIKTLGKRLNITEESAEQAILALKVFIAQHQKAFQQITANKKRLPKINSDIRQRAQTAVKENKEKLHQEIRESQELYQLLIKARTTKLSREEKEKVRSQLVDIMKTLPVFVIIGLPGTFMTLPFLISILPSQFFPTAFQNLKNEEKIDEKKE